MQRPSAKAASSWQWNQLLPETGAFDKIVLLLSKAVAVLRNWNYKWITDWEIPVGPKRCGPLIMRSEIAVFCSLSPIASSSALLCNEPNIFAPHPSMTIAQFGKPITILQISSWVNLKITLNWKKRGTENTQAVTVVFPITETQSKSLPLLNLAKSADLSLIDRPSNSSVVPCCVDAWVNFHHYIMRWDCSCLPTMRSFNANLSAIRFRIDLSPSYFMTL